MTDAEGGNRFVNRTYRKFFGSDPGVAVRIGYETAWASPFVYLAKPVVVNLTDEYSETPFLRLRVKAYVFGHRYENRMKADITVRAKKEFSRLKIFDGWHNFTER